MITKKTFIYWMVLSLFVTVDFFIEAASIADINLKKESTYFRNRHSATRKSKRSKVKSDRFSFWSLPRSLKRNFSPAFNC